ncbi:MAG: InlB B-repeat-containing protein, partial [Thermoplasmata archaeon]
VIDADPPRFDSKPELVRRYETNNSVRLAWEEAEGTSEPFEYRIHHNVTGLDIDEARFDTDRWSKSTEDTSIVLEELDPTGMHNIKISVVNDVGLTNTSADTLSFQVEDNLPPKFDGLDSTYVKDYSEKKIGLVWDDAEDPVEPISYHIYHSKDENMSFEDPIATTDQTEKRIQVSEVGEHHFAVRAEDGEGNEDSNDVVKVVRVKDTDSPDVRISGPSEGASVEHAVTLKWKVLGDSNISKYWVKSDHQDNWFDVDREKSNYTFEWLPEGERTLEIMAEDIYGNIGRDRVNLTVKPGNSKPEIISRSPVDGAEKIDTEAELQVEIGNAGDDGSVVYFCDGNDDGLIGKIEDVKTDGELSVDWTGLEHGTTYRWYVIIEQGENTVRSKTWEFETLHLFDLNVDVEGNGSVEPSEGTHTYEEGKNVELEASPDDGWQFSSWSGDHNADERNVEVEMDKDKQVTAHFEKIEEKIEYELRVNITGEGSIGIDEGTHTFAEGENISLQAISDEGWYFENWTGDLQDDDEWLNFTIEDDMNLTANFEEKEEQGDGNTNDGESGIEDDEGTGDTLIGSLTLLDKVLLLILVGLVVTATIYHVREKD